MRIFPLISIDVRSCSYSLINYFSLVRTKQCILSLQDTQFAVPERNTFCPILLEYKITYGLLKYVANSFLTSLKVTFSPYAFEIPVACAQLPAYVHFKLNI